jgi:hypothetical protein
MLLIDANARVGTTTSQAIGACNPEEGNDTGMRTQVFLESLRLSAVNTFFSCGGTWASSHDVCHRIDYICCTNEDLDVFSDVVVGGDVDLAPGNKDDHKLVSAAASLRPSGDYKPSRRKSAQMNGKRWFNVDALGVPYLRDRFAWKMWGFYADWDQQVDVHLIS